MERKPADVLEGARAPERVLAGRYRVIRRLGTGGMASVFLAEDSRLSREVAVKQMHASSAEDDAKRFAREAKLGAALNHPNVVTVFDTVADRDSVLIVMEYVPGRDLGDALREGALDHEHVIAVLRAVAAALDHAHHNGIVHRDVKPANVLLRDDGSTKLADLGIAKAMEDTALTHSNALLGTPLYMAPEQLEGERATPATDVYSLALIAYEALSGERARRKGDLPLITHQATREPPPDLREPCPHTPPAAAEVLKRALDPDPARRPGSATAFVDDLERALAGEGRPTQAAAPPPSPPPPPARTRPPFEPPPPLPRRRRATTLIPLALLALVAAAIVIASLAGGGGEDSGQQQAAREQGGDGGAEQSGGGAGAGEEAAAPAAGAGTPSPTSHGTAAAGSPAEPVQRFYELAAAGDYKGAWALAGGGFRSQLGGYGAFEQQVSTLESVEFQSLEVTGQSGDTAQVSFSDVATHTDHTDRCTGSFTVVRGGNGWLIDGADVSCSPG